MSVVRTIGPLVYYLMSVLIGSCKKPVYTFTINAAVQHDCSRFDQTGKIVVNRMGKKTIKHHLGRVNVHNLQPLTVVHMPIYCSSYANKLCPYVS